MINFVVGFVCLAELAKLPSQYKAFANVIVEDRSVDFQLLLSDDYDLDMPPKVNGFPTEVSVLFLPSKIVEISLEKMTLRISGTLGFIWSDQRITMECNSSIAPYTQFFLHRDEIERIWKPLLTYRNAMSSTLLTGNVKYFSGNFMIELRKTATFHCSFDLSSYPMDTQQCKMEVQAINYKSSVILTKYERLHKFSSKSDPQEYRIVEVNNGNCTSGDHFSAYYSCLEYGFTIKRRLGRHLIQAFIPSGLVVVLSWVSFWLDPASSIAPRVSMGVTTMLTLTRQFGSIQHDLPALSYLKAVDVWMLTCIFMVFSTLLEFAIVYGNKNKSVQPTRTPLANEILEKCRPKLAWNLEFKHTSCATDKFSRRAFPLFFICFNVIFWCYYCL